MWSAKAEVLVGLFVVAAVVALGFLSFQVSGLAFSQGGGEYRLHALFTDVSGLNSRAKVSIAGVNVGRVESIELDEASQSAKVSILIDSAVDFLTTDSSARILTSGLLGEKYIELSSGADEDFLRDGDYIELTQSSIILENLIARFVSGS